MKRVVILSSLFVFATIIIAADSTVTVDSVLSGVGSVVEAIKGYRIGQATALIVMAAIVKLLLTLMKLPAVAKLLDSPKMKAYKPYIAIVIGILSGIGTGMPTDQSMIASIITGAVVGLSSIGIHETVKTTNTMRKKKKVVQVVQVAKEVTPAPEVKPVAEAKPETIVKPEGPTHSH